MAAPIPLVLAGKIRTVQTSPFDDQKPGTSGLRKKVVRFREAHYVENFVQATFNALASGRGDDVCGQVLVVSGDGRYYSDVVMGIILRMAAAHGVKQCVVGEGGLLSTPAVSEEIRSRSAAGGFILTASHNPGGPDADFGIKYNGRNGGPAPAVLTNAIFAESKNLAEFRILDVDVPEVLSGLWTQRGQHQLGDMLVECVDPTAAYTALMRRVFDFDAISRLMARADFCFLYDAMAGVAGPYAKRIFAEELGAPADTSLLNATPKPDFNGKHPDPNLTYADELVPRMGLSRDGKSVESSAGPEAVIPELGAAADGDADRNMILAPHFFVNPSDSVAIIADYAERCISYFAKGLKGVARSMPTSQALDRVAKAHGVPLYEVPTGWKYFGNLMDAGKLSICGEESFGTSSDHVREKDGVWAVLCWLSILEFRNRDTPVGSLVTVRQVVEEHWRKYGRNFYTRYDFEGVDSDGARALMDGLIARFQDDNAGIENDRFKVEQADEFRYEDPVDGSVAEHQGIRYVFSDGSRIVFRLSGTGTQGATIRVYIERFVDKDSDELLADSQEALRPLVELAVEFAGMKRHVGRTEPSVIT